MASKFWGRGSDSEEETSEEEQSSTEEETSSSEESSNEGSSSESGSESDDSSKSKKGASRFLMGSSDSESDNERRVVRSAKYKARADLLATCAEIRSKAESDEWAAVQSLFDRMQKQLERLGKLTSPSAPPPRAFIRALVALEDELARCLADKPKLSPTNTRALLRMKQTLRRSTPPHADAMAAARERPESESEESEESEGPAPRGGRGRGGGSGDEDEAESDWGSGSEAEARAALRGVR
ncbi:hypothetical protein H632_c729p0, partial [Helicosporidium sp. ATCC 50920]